MSTINFMQILFKYTRNFFNIPFVYLSMADFKSKRKCSTDENHRRLIQQEGERYKINRLRCEQDVLKRISNPMRPFRSGGLAGGGFNEGEPMITIPVVVHVVYKTKEQNISDEQIFSQMDVLDRDFRKKNIDRNQIPEVWKSIAADTRIEFDLATVDPNGNPGLAITRTHTNKNEFIDNDDVKFDSKGGKNAWDTTRYLNIWVCKLGNDLLGYAQFPNGPPETDGVVISYEAFGTIGTAKAPFALGRTTTHEIGHYLDVFHIWGDENLLEDPCSRTDNVIDTPNQKGPNTGKHTFPSHKEDCPNTGENGTMFCNYMDYVWDESMYMFTLGQYARMRATLGGPRRTLLTSDVLRKPEQDLHLASMIRLPAKVYDGIDAVKPVEQIM
jgi:hypothetical protein